MDKEKSDRIPAESPLLTDAMRTQILSVMEKLTQDVWIRSVVELSQEKSMEMAGFLRAFAAISPRLHLVLCEAGEDQALETELDCRGLYPVTGLYLQENAFTGISFRGIPGGQEINSFVIAFYNAASPGQPLEDGIRDRILALQEQQNVRIFVSLGCHYCAETVILAQHIAALNDRVHVQMTDAGMYPSLVEQYGLERVPVLLCNESRRSVGGKTMEQLLDFLEQSGE